MTLCNSFDFSGLNYEAEVHANTNMEFLFQMKMSQNKVLRILKFKHRKSPVNDLYVTFGVLKLADMKKYNFLTIMHKFMHTPNELPTALKDLFIQHSEIHGYNTRNKYDLHATHVNTMIYGHKKLSCITRHYWNSLDFQENSLSRSLKICLKEIFSQHMRNVNATFVRQAYTHYTINIKCTNYTGFPKYIYLLLQVAVNLWESEIGISGLVWGPFRAFLGTFSFQLMMEFLRNWLWGASGRGWSC